MVRLGKYGCTSEYSPISSDCHYMAISKEILFTESDPYILVCCSICFVCRQMFFVILKAMFS